MSESISAAIHLYDSTFSFAEIERLDSSHCLRRVNRRTFSFDVLEVLKGDAESEAFDRLAEALRDELTRTEASTVKMVIHPLAGFSFFTLVSAELSVQDRKQALVQQAALVTGARSARTLHLALRTVRTVPDHEGGSLVWIHVLVLPDEVESRVAKVVDESPVRGHSWMVSSEAAAHLMGGIEGTRPSHEEALQPYSLAIGEYPTHTEYALSRNREWHHAHFTQAADRPEDRAYYAVAFLNRIDVPAKSIGRLFLYGSEVDLDAYAPLESIFGPQPEYLDPLHVVQKMDEETSEDDIQSHVLGIGAGLTPFLE